MTSAESKHTLQDYLEHFLIFFFCDALIALSIIQPELVENLPTTLSQAVMAPLSSSSSKSTSESHISRETLENEPVVEFSPSGSEGASDDDDDDDEAKPIPLSSIRKREQYSKFNSWSVL